MVGGLLPAAQAGVDFGPLLDGTVSSTVFYRMLGYESAAGSRVGASRRQDCHQICRWVWLRLGPWKGSFLVIDGSLG